MCEILHPEDIIHRIRMISCVYKRHLPLDSEARRVKRNRKLKTHEGRRSFSDSGRFSSMTLCLIISRFSLKSPSLYHHPVTVHADVKVDENIFPCSCFLLLFCLPVCEQNSKIPLSVLIPYSSINDVCLSGLGSPDYIHVHRDRRSRRVPSSPRLLFSLY